MRIRASVVVHFAVAPCSWSANKAEDRLNLILEEAGKLVSVGTWDVNKVREWRDVALEARNKGTVAHVGRVFPICSVKNAELDESDPRRKHKGRVVFQGNEVRDHRGQYAVFAELGACPTGVRKP